MILVLVIGVIFIPLALDKPLAAEYRTGKWATFQEFKDEVDKATTNKHELVQQFLYQAKEHGVPWIDGDMATFIHYGKLEQTVYVAGDMTGWQPGIDTMKPVQGTNLYYITKKFPMDARLDYKLVVDDTFKLDPLNPNAIMSGFGPNSELNMPGYNDPIEIGYFDDIPHGKIIENTIRSTILDEDRKIKIYVPHNYNPKREYPSLYVHDGYEFISIAKMDNILDYLIYSKSIRPIIAIFIPPIHREDEYVHEDEYAKFIFKELVPYIDDKYSTILL